MLGQAFLAPTDTCLATSPAAANERKWGAYGIKEDGGNREKNTCVCMKTSRQPFGQARNTLLTLRSSTISDKLCHACVRMEEYTVIPTVCFLQPPHVTFFWSRSDEGSGKHVMVPLAAQGTSAGKYPATGMLEEL